jgi:hypothetical protein
MVPGNRSDSRQTKNEKNSAVLLYEMGKTIHLI